MKSKRMILAGMICLCLLAGGCRFAAEERESERDTLAGISVRVERWGEADGEEALEETTLDKSQIDALLNGGEVSLWRAGERALGERYFYLNRTTDERGEAMIGLEGKDWPGILNQAVALTDEGETYDFQSVVYVCGRGFGRDETADSVASPTDEGELRAVFGDVLHLDAVYRRPDGTFYASSTGGVSGAIDGYAQKIEQSFSSTDAQGEKRGETVRIEVKVEYVNELCAAEILAFDASHALISREALVWQDAQAGIEVSFPEEAAYLVLETRGLDRDGALVTARSVRDLPARAGDCLFTLYVPDGTGLAVPVEVRIPEAASQSNITNA